MTTTTMITTDPAALLCDDADCRCAAALRQIRDRTRTPVPSR